MKLITANGKQILKMTRIEWEKLGNEKGWIKADAKKKVNPWAVCHTTVDKDKDPEKYEKCVMDVKKKNK